MKWMKILVIVVLIGILSACSSNISPAATSTASSTEIPTQIPTATPAPTPSSTPYMNFSIQSLLKLSEYKLMVELGYPFKSSNSYFPVTENGDWKFRDDFGQTTLIKNSVIKDDATFEIYRIGGKAYEVTAPTGTIIKFLLFHSNFAYPMYYATSVNNFVYCNVTDMKPPYCFNQPSTVVLIVWENGKVIKYYDEKVDDWCEKPTVETGINFVSHPYYSTYYKVEGDETLYHWVKGNCPKVTIEELTE